MGKFSQGKGIDLVALRDQLTILTRMLGERRVGVSVRGGLPASFDVPRQSSGGKNSLGIDFDIYEMRKQLSEVSAAVRALARSQKVAPVDLVVRSAMFEVISQASDALGEMSAKEKKRRLQEAFNEELSAILGGERDG